LNSNCIDVNLNLWVKKLKIVWHLGYGRTHRGNGLAESIRFFFFFFLPVIVEIYTVLERKNETKFLERSLGFTIWGLLSMMLFFGFSVFNRFETIRVGVFLIGLAKLYFLF
jgi:hypothetical protein